ncbi:acyl carrier protein [Chitinophaga nivalis]|uniref:Acyl carrier protein n=1 Tax=Chitinophaga nivalis TaxID=2991709 RepID=A0ABT3IQQ8_9BACT|nr:acyl carrier protein [Chitinophaga nivalis]MCW3464006.1 acyl carrier protein [Chitinophaga nivalis]MCW3486304.1 acyl carrier protein [Chitinophaga nivalis]
MGNNNIEQTVISVISNEAKRPPDTITRDSHLGNDLGMTSILAAAVFFKVSDQLGVTLEPESLTGFNTVGEVIDYFEKKAPQ